MSTNELPMLPMVTHVNLSEKTVEARAYQLEALNEILTNSMMLVLPTAAGKTAVAWMATAEKLTKSDGWILWKNEPSEMLKTVESPLVV